MALVHVEMFWGVGAVSALCRGLWVPEATVLSKKKFRGCTCALFLVAGRVSLGKVGHGMRAGFLWESCTEEPVEKLQLSTKGRTSAGIRYRGSYVLNKISSLLLPACLPPSQVGINHNFSNWACKWIVLGDKSCSSILSLLWPLCLLNSNPPSAAWGGRCQGADGLVKDIHATDFRFQRRSSRKAWTSAGEALQGGKVPGTVIPGEDKKSTAFG